MLFSGKNIAAGPALARKKLKTLSIKIFFCYIFIHRTAPENRSVAKDLRIIKFSLPASGGRQARGFMDSGTGSIDTVLFDYGGVIAEEGFRGGLYAIAQLNGLDAEAFHRQVSRSIADCGYLTGRADEAAFWKALRREHTLQQTDAQLREEILRRFTLRPEMLGIVSRLRQSGLRVGMISDQTNWLDELDRRDGFFACFDRIFNSYHEHASKYDDTLFAVVAAGLHASPGRILIVDDNAGNIDKARRRGFPAILYDTEQGFLREMQRFFPQIFPDACPGCKAGGTKKL